MWLNKKQSQGQRGKVKGLILSLALHLWPCALFADPLQDQFAFRDYYQQKFPHLKLEDYANGVYAIDAVAKQSWLAIEEFPPYEPAIEQGKALFETAFKNGSHYADCFPNQGIGIANDYPQWDSLHGEVVTLAGALNACRMRHQQKPMIDRDQDMVYLLAYLAFTSRGKAIHVVIPDDDPLALAAYEKGKAFYYQRRGQLNFACATCHVQNVGKRIRSELLSPSLGHTGGWPTYRLKWGEIGTLHRRFSECLEQIKAQEFPAQSVDYRNLEYFLGFMSNGIPITGPSTRK
ncbi:MAG: sulfur oxidation c-type cytochrome SoxA [Methylococcaceae bacterium]|nr:sulfur oxidation c-type cytochrome SoxA [Methylococcaceae bacterium]